MTHDPAPPHPRPFLGVHLRCCNLYVRIYANADHTAFAGWCPRCSAQITVPIVHEGGSSSRIVSAS